MKNSNFENNYSVLMSVYDKENPVFLKASLNSMLSQTIMPNQIVIVEDGTLNTDLEKVIKEFENKYKEIVNVIRREKNRGLGFSLNEGLKVCKNDLVARMDSDDISLSDRCEKQLEKFNKNSKLVILGGQINEFCNNKNEILSQRRVPSAYNEIKKFSRRRSPFNHPTVMFRKSNILEMGGYPEVRRKEDLKLFLDIVFSNHYCENLEDTVLLYRTSPDNFKRRKTFTNCKEYIEIMYGYFKTKNISLLDYTYVLVGQISLFVLPTGICKCLSDKLLRKKIEYERMKRND